LLHAIGQAHQPAGRRVVYVTAETFTNDLVESIRDKKMDAFRARYRDADTLLVDDIQFLAGKTGTEEEFYHTFNAVTSQGGQIVVTCNQHPRQIGKLDDRVRARLEGGLLADLQPPDAETRLAILQAKSVAQGHPLPPDVARLLAAHETASVREVEGLLTQMLARVALTKERLTLALAEQVLIQNGADIPPTLRAMRKPRLEDLLEKTAHYYQLSPGDLLGKSRAQNIARARHVVMYLAREETGDSLAKIGESLGGRSHSTVCYGHKKIAASLADDAALQREINNIRRQLNLF
jgi:chromosomal replication initiator protein